MAWQHLERAGCGVVEAADSRIGLAAIALATPSSIRPGTGPSA